jgi:hypothetical protein
MTVPARSVSPPRVVAVTAGLSVAGGAFGAAAGATALGIVLAASGDLRSLSDLFILGIPASIGAGLGAVCAPIAGWLLLRHIPLGRAFVGLTLGTVLGGVAGWYLGDDPFIRPVILAAIGFLCSAVLMRVLHRRPGSVTR